MLVDYYQRRGLNKRSIRVAERILRMSPANGLSDAPLYLRKRVCPMHFTEFVEVECMERDVDPNTFYSLMRQESLFINNLRLIIKKSYNHLYWQFAGSGCVCGSELIHLNLWIPVYLTKVT